MNRERVRGLWARFLGGEPLGAAEEEELLDGLRHDEPLRAEALEDLQVDGVLHFLKHKDEGAGAFEKGFIDLLENDRTGTGFIRKVQQRLTDQKRFHRRTGRRLREGPGRLLAPAAVAAAFLVVLILAAVLAPGPARKPAPTVRRPEAPRPAVESIPAAPRGPLPVETEARKPEAPPPPPREPEKPPAVAEGARPAVAVPKNPDAPAVRPAEPRTPPAPAPDKTAVTAARLDRLEGEVYVVAKDGRTAAKSGMDLVAGQGLEVAERAARATVRFGDGTVLELGAGTKVPELFDHEPAAKGARGKRVALEKGEVRADVVKQSAEQPMVFLTPHGEATVLGTVLRILVDPDPRTGLTRLEVLEGRVRLKRASDRKTVDVPSGYLAVAASGVDLAARPLLLLADGFESGTLTSQWRVAAEYKDVWRPAKDPDGRGWVLKGGTWDSQEFPDRYRGALMCGQRSWADYAIEASVRFETVPTDKSSVCGVLLLGRMQDFDTFYRMEYSYTGSDPATNASPTAGVWVGVNIKGVRKGIWGSPVPLPQPGRWYTLRFEITGPRLRGYLDGELKITAEDTELKSGPAGLIRADCHGMDRVILWDNVRVLNAAGK